MSAILCSQCGRKISKERLKAVSDTKLCIRCARKEVIDQPEDPSVKRLIKERDLEKLAIMASTYRHTDPNPSLTDIIKQSIATLPEERRRYFKVDEIRVKCLERLSATSDLVRENFLLRERVKDLEGYVIGNRKEKPTVIVKGLSVVQREHVRICVNHVCHVGITAHRPYGESTPIAHYSTRAEPGYRVYNRENLFELVKEIILTCQRNG